MRSVFSIIPILISVPVFGSQPIRYRVLAANDAAAYVAGGGIKLRQEQNKAWKSVPMPNRDGLLEGWILNRSDYSEVDWQGRLWVVKRTTVDYFTPGETWRPIALPQTLENEFALDLMTGIAAIRGTIWIAKGNRLSKYDTGTETWSVINLPEVYYGGLVPGKDGTLWCGPGLRYDGSEFLRIDTSHLALSSSRRAAQKNSPSTRVGGLGSRASIISLVMSPH
jgi:hypothetical protein